MTLETTFEHPPEGHVGLLAYNSDSDEWEAVHIDDDGNLQVEVPTPATGGVVYNVTMTSADTEYNQTLVANCKKFMLKCRGAYDVKVCFTSGLSGVTYITVPSGRCYWEDLIRDVAITLYFQCATAAQVAEIVAWD